MLEKISPRIINAILELKVFFVSFFTLFSWKNQSWNKAVSIEQEKKQLLYRGLVHFALVMWRGGKFSFELILFLFPTLRKTRKNEFLHSGFNKISKYYHLLLFSVHYHHLFSAWVPSESACLQPWTTLVPRWFD